MSTYSNRLQPALQTYYVLFGSFTQDRHARRIYLLAADKNRS